MIDGRLTLAFWHPVVIPFQQTPIQQTPQEPFIASNGW